MTFFSTGNYIIDVTYMLSKIGVSDFCDPRGFLFLSLNCTLLIRLKKGGHVNNACNVAFI